MVKGYQDRQDREWNRTRHIMSYIANFSGFGSKDFIDPKTIWALPIDRQSEKKYIQTLKQCLEMIQEFEESINNGS